MRKIIYILFVLQASVLLYSFTIYSPSEIKQVVKYDTTAEYKKLIVGKWINYKMIVMGSEVVVPEDVASYDIYKSDGTVERGNDTYGYNSGDYEIKGSSITMGATFKIEKLTEDEFVYSMVTEYGEVKNCLKKVKK